MRNVSGTSGQTSQCWLLFALLGAALLCLFHQSLNPHYILFDNDHTLGERVVECNRLPGRFTGTWTDNAWLGGDAPAASPSITMSLATVLSPVVFLKMYAPLTLLFLGFSAWLFFRQLNFGPMVCVLGGVAAGLNGHFLSIACWGLGHWELAAACTFLAMAALNAKAIPRVWERAVLAGLAVGMGVMEGYDVGAILSIYLGVYLVFHLFVNNNAPLATRAVNVAVGGALVVLFAAVIAYQTMHTLVETEVEGVAAMNQDEQTRESRWNPATQWSLPKAESLQVMVPGLFGYRLSGNIDETNHSSAYWGRIGQAPQLPLLGSDDPVVRSNALTAMKLGEAFRTNLDTPDRLSRTPGLQNITRKSGIYWRYSGSGECAGVLVSLLAIFGVANIFRSKAEGVFSKSEWMSVVYWGAVAVFSLLAAWGRFGFIYQFIYKLPYFSTIRNPIKFMHPFHIAWIILAAYGMEVLYRRYMRNYGNKSTDVLVSQIHTWWKRAVGFERKWAIFMLAFAGVAILGTVLLAMDRNDHMRYLREQSFTLNQARQISAFTLEEAVIFVAFLLGGMLIIAAVLCGAWTGRESKWAWSCMAILMIWDLARADVPWLHYYDYREKYVMNAATEFLIDKPWEHRVIGKLEPRGPGSGVQPGLGQLYFFWLQNDFPYHNIQTLDFSQASHMPDLDRVYLKAFELVGADIASTDLRPAARLWQLTNTRYFFGNAGALQTLNVRADPIHHAFKLKELMKTTQKPGVAAVEISDYTVVEAQGKGDCAMIEYDRALPRAKLFSNWLTPSNDVATLGMLTNQDFEPLNTVLIATNTPPPQPRSDSTADAGEVTIAEYHPKVVKLDANAKTAAVLLLNDRWDSNWRVTVDGNPAPMLRCNFIMRGVYLTAGQHKVEFKFSPSITGLYVSVSAILAGALLAGFLIVTRKHPEREAAPVAPVPATPAPVAANSAPPANPPSRPQVAVPAGRPKPKKG